jgi:ankyrin repeat protein
MKVWNILLSSRNGDLETVKQMVNECPELIYAQYNYTPPIHFAVREGHTHLVKYLLNNEAHQPKYKTYPFLDSLQTIANERGFTEIEILLEGYAKKAGHEKFKEGENGKIQYNRTPQQLEFEKAVSDEDLIKTARILELHPEFALDETYFWGEGILTFAAKKNNRKMIELLIRYGAKVPAILKWTQFYYFERYDGAAFMMEKGMNPNTMSWHHVTILHDMAQKGFIDKAELLLSYGADINLIEEEYQSTPIALAARWGHEPMVEYLIKQGANLNKAGAEWATPLSWAKKRGHPGIEKLLLNAGAT